MPVCLVLLSDTLQNGIGRGIGLLQINTPIAQIVDLNFLSRHAAKHKTAGAHNRIIVRSKRFIMILP